MLIEKGVLTADQLRIALTEQRKRDGPLGKIIVALGFATEVHRARCAERVARSGNRRARPRRSSTRRPEAHSQGGGTPLSHPAALAGCGAPWHDSGNGRHHQRGGAGPAAGTARRAPARSSRCSPAETEIENAIDQYYGYELSIDGILHEIETGEIDYQQPAGRRRRVQPAGGAPGRCAADRRGASAAPRTSTSSPNSGSCASATASTACCARCAACTRIYWPAMAVRLKVMSGMNIAETRAPQDGRISLDAVRPADRFPRRGAADHPRREHRAAHPRPAEGHRAARPAGPRRRRSSTRSS